MNGGTTAEMSGGQTDTDGIICGIFTARPHCSCPPWIWNELGKNWRFHPLSVTAGWVTHLAQWKYLMAEDDCYFLSFFSHPRETIVAYPLSPIAFYTLRRRSEREERVRRCCVVFLPRRSSFLRRRGGGERRGRGRLEAMQWCPP